ncbi:MAG: redoxin domain-containing protein [Actinobacteria bacterium]|nr:redoxin domain-containing protein [Actinomycetota bacterium]
MALLAALAVLLAACSGGGDGADTTVATTPARPASYAGTEPAHEFPAGLDWLNTAGPLTLADLRGKVVLLDFWTYGCINCIHIIGDLQRLEQEYADELAVIGVHSAKFDNEGETDNIREIVQRYGLEHPVVNDRDFEVWTTWGARAWPTVVAIDPAGNIVGGYSGEGVYAVFQPVVDSLVAEFDARGEIDRTPIAIDLERDTAPSSVLSYPGKVEADAEGGRLFVADTNHHRILVADLATGEILDVAGGDDPGYEDGSFEAARFDQPQGMALSGDGSTLYVADTGNHAVRAVHLDRRVVETVLGTGYQAASYPPNPGTAPSVEIASPWDVLLDGGMLYIAMAGSHQIWQLDLASGLAGPTAGSGREGVGNGPSAGASLAQPSGLALDGPMLYFADSESSSIRVADVAADETLLVAGASSDLFTFGDADGVGAEARFQHPLGVAFGGGMVWVADTYNDKIKRIDPVTRQAVTLSGYGRGWADGDLPRFYEPGGIDYAGGLLYVADTNNHAIRVVDPDTGAARTLVLYGIERFAGRGDGYRGVEVALDPVTVAPGDGTLVVDVTLPDGYKVNDLAPYSMEWIVDGGIATPGPGAEREIVAPEFPLTAPVEFTAGSGAVTADLTVYYCTADAESLCLIERVRVTVPIEVAAGGAQEVRFTYSIEPPEVGF